MTGERVTLITMRTNPAMRVLRVKAGEFHSSHTEFEKLGQILSALSKKELDAGAWSSEDRCSLGPELWISSTQMGLLRPRTGPKKTPEMQTTVSHFSPIPVYTLKLALAVG